MTSADDIFESAPPASALLEGMLWDHVYGAIPEALERFDDAVWPRMEPNPICHVSGACVIGEDLIGYYFEGHVPAAMARWNVRWSDDLDMLAHEWASVPVRQVWMREVPYSLMFPDEPPCEDGPEVEVFEYSGVPRRGFRPITIVELDQ